MAKQLTVDFVLFLLRKTKYGVGRLSYAN